MTEQTASMIIDVLTYTAILGIIAICSYYAGKYWYVVQKEINDINQKKKDV